MSRPYKNNENIFGDNIRKLRTDKGAVPFDFTRIVTLSRFFKVSERDLIIKKIEEMNK